MNVKNLNKEENFKLKIMKKANINTTNERNYPDRIYKTGQVYTEEYAFVARVTRESNYAIYCCLNGASYEPIRVYMGKNGDEIPSGFHRTPKEAIEHGIKIYKNRVKNFEEDLEELVVEMKS